MAVIKASKVSFEVIKQNVLELQLNTSVSSAMSL